MNETNLSHIPFIYLTSPSSLYHSLYLSIHSFTLVALGYPLSQLDENSPAAKKSDYLIQKNDKKLWDEIVLERAKHPLI